jgi:hypothetical protein
MKNKCPNCHQPLVYSEYFDTEYCGYCGWYEKPEPVKTHKGWNRLALALILIMVSGFIPVITGMV